ncbi:MAG TPA: DUF6587 family protein [Xanthomonadaceae bacterium]|nr:DUF6587 family protein [Xanthomonadaceae bacterium]
MDAGLLAQYAVVALAVLASLLVVARKQFPEGLRRLRIACAVPLVREQRPRWIRGLGRWLAPEPRPAGAEAGCGTCNACDSGRK